LEAAIWFFSGALAFRMLSKLLEHYQAVRHATESALYTLRLCAVIVHDVEFIRVLKYKHLLETGVKDDQIQLIKDIDQQTIDNWKRSIIAKFKQTLPPSVKNVFTFTDWTGAMKVLDIAFKKERGRR